MTQRPKLSKNDAKKREARSVMKKISHSLIMNSIVLGKIELGTTTKQVELKEKNLMKLKRKSLKTLGMVLI